MSAALALTKPAPVAPPPPPHEPDWLSPQDLFLFNEGSHVRLYDKLGAHPHAVAGVAGYQFAVWAPNAGYVAVVGDFNGWNPGANPLAVQGESGVWAGFLPGVNAGTCYKFHVSSRHNGYQIDKADPFARAAEIAPKQASVTWDLQYQWHDAGWMGGRKERFAHAAPVSIYECHLGSWMKHDAARSLSYREVAPKLADHCRKLGFTHVEFLPLTEHPYYGSWGYQVTGYFAPTSRYGTPQDLMFLIDHLHQQGVGVIIDWVPSHFATDGFALGYFDGTHLFEHGDPKQGYHPDWGSFVFNYGRHEVRSFLLSAALFWLDKYHVDGIRVDAVASMLYLDYSRKDGGWVPNRYGGRENIESIEFLKRLNHEVYTHFPDVQTVAEESTAWPLVSRPAYVGGLGFGYKWDMGWMHDTLRYCHRDPLYRKHHHNELTFRSVYADTENYVLPLSHDEVVHGKGPLWDKMSGDDWQKFATLRALFAYQWATPGKKLLFMGGEFAQRREWRHDDQLDWHLLEQAPHAGVQALVGELNRLYRTEPALHEGDCTPGGQEWVAGDDASNSVYCFLRLPREGPDRVLCVLNFTPRVLRDYRVGVPGPGYWSELLNTDAAAFGGSNVGNQGGLHAEYTPQHGRPYSLNLTVPPLAAVWFKGQV